MAPPARSKRGTAQRVPVPRRKTLNFHKGRNGGRRDRTPDAHDVTETDLAADKMGNNQLQGDDQEKVHNERHAQAEVTTETDSIMEGLKRKEK